MGAQAAIRGALLGAIWAAGAHAIEESAPTAPDDFRAACLMQQACIIDRGCSAIPAMGELLLVGEAGGYVLGSDPERLSPIEVFPNLDAVHPLPVIAEPRRELLVRLPREATARRFALFTQTRDPDTGAPILRRRYFTLECYDTLR